ncbi:NADH dehydrogenase [Tistlia consotensis]|uniref:NADH dehydrogenase n=1 Tax=Tistlia consotensis USBA 355 TaxID=560819 RepID=A0A1Y6B5E8_9PROT|nr:complex I NDUFA9 subunit family protein [Tistlia consotensis]SME93216.1 NADH dehydrogenase [Tistlia consotensis USBA 355]SNR28491.1 NADH dehydrogenase [Tistlia consotensis]
MAAGTITIFGGSGFIGRYVVARLADSGWTIRVAVRRPERAKFLKPLGNVGQVVPIACSVRDQASVEAAVAGSDAAINLVGILFQQGRQRFDAVQAEGAERVAAAAAAAGIGRFVQVSAIGADEKSPSAYGRSKAAGEAAVRRHLPGAAIVRPSIVFGPEDDFFNRFAAMARLSPVLPLIGGGKTRFQPVYVGDVADAVVAALDGPREGAPGGGRTFELGGPKVHSFKELMELMLRIVRRKRLLLPLPFGLASLMALPAELLPVPPLTRDQVELLKRDNVVSPGAEGLEAFGIHPHSLEVILPTYLDRYRPGGRFMEHLPHGM